MTDVSTPLGEASAGDRVTRMTSVSVILRTLGAALLVAATSTFMLQRWEVGGDIARYLTLLALTATLTAAGVACGLVLRESRGARTFLALVVASVPVHFAVVGALLQSQFPWDQAGTPSAPWNAGSPLAALGVTAVGLATLMPLTWLSMLTLVRPHALRLTGMFVCINLALLLPVRAPDTVAWLIAVGFVLFLTLERRIARMGHAVSTREGLFVRAMMLVPVGIIIGRTLLWYHPGELFFGIAVLASSLTCFLWIPRIRGDGADVRILQPLGAFGAVTGWFLVTVAIVDTVTIPEDTVLLLYGLPSAALLFFLSTRSAASGPAYNLVATLTAIGTTLVNLLSFWDPHRLSVAGLVALVVGVSFLGYGIYCRRRVPLALGPVTAACGLLQLLVAAIEIETFYHWGSMAIGGGLLIFLAALCERHARRMIAYAGAIRERVLEWEP